MSPKYRILQIPSILRVATTGFWALWMFMVHCLNQMGGSWTATIGHSICSWMLQTVCGRDGEVLIGMRPWGPTWPSSPLSAKALYRLDWFHLDVWGYDMLVQGAEIDYWTSWAIWLGNHAQTLVLQAVWPHIARFDCLFVGEFLQFGVQSICFVSIQLYIPASSHLFGLGLQFHPEPGDGFQEPSVLRDSFPIPFEKN